MRPLSPRAQAFLATMDRNSPRFPTARVPALLEEKGCPVVPAWLDFHERYAGYVEGIYEEAACWGLVHEDNPCPYWLPKGDVEVDLEAKTIQCAEVHPSFGYELDQEGQLFAHQRHFDSFDRYVEQFALFRYATTTLGFGGCTNEFYLLPVSLQSEILEKALSRPDVDASDAYAAMHLSDRYLVTIIRPDRLYSFWSWGLPVV